MRFNVRCTRTLFENVNYSNNGCGSEWLCRCVFHHDCVCVCVCLWLSLYLCFLSYFSNAYTYQQVVILKYYKLTTKHTSVFSFSFAAHVSSMRFLLFKDHHFYNSTSFSMYFENNILYRRWYNNESSICVYLCVSVLFVFGKINIIDYWKSTRCPTKLLINN